MERIPGRKAPKKEAQKQSQKDIEGVREEGCVRFCLQHRTLLGKIEKMGLDG